MKNLIYLACGLFCFAVLGDFAIGFWEEFSKEAPDWTEQDAGFHLACMGGITIGVVAVYSIGKRILTS